jgi:hypothetical protein
MSTSRRKFLVGGLGATGLLTSAVTADDKVASSAAVKCLDYGRSFIGHTGSNNSVRFWIESRTTIVDAKGVSHEFFQCGSCKSEDTFVEKDLFKADNYDFLPIIGHDSVVLFRRHANVRDGYRDVRPKVAVWGTPVFQLRDAEEVTVLDTGEKVCKATAEGLPIVAQTEIAHPESGARAIIEHPIKTMNTDPSRGLWQTDSGPVAFPELDKLADPPIDCLRLAFVAFNASHFADFVIEQPVAIVADGREAAQVYHYSKPFSLPAKNTLLGLGKLG